MKGSRAADRSPSRDRQRLCVPSSGDEPLAQDRPRLDARIDDRETHEAHIEVAAHQRRDLCRCGHVAQPELDAGQRGTESQQEIREQLNRREAEADPQHAQLSPHGAACDVERRRRLLQQPCGARQQHLSRGRQPHLAVPAPHQRPADRFLQPLDLLGQRRLGDMESIRRPAEMQLLRQRDERAQLRHRKRHSKELSHQASSFIGQNETGDGTLGTQGGLMAADNVTMLVGCAAAICTTLSFVPQLVKIRRQGGRDLSDGMLGLYLLGLTLWLAYGVRIEAAEVIGANVVAGTLVIAAVVMKRRSGHIGGCGGRTRARARTLADTDCRTAMLERVKALRPAQRASMGTHDRSSDAVSSDRLQPHGVGRARRGRAEGPAPPRLREVGEPVHAHALAEGAPHQPGARSRRRRDAAERLCSTTWPPSRRPWSG